MKSILILYSTTFPYAGRYINGCWQESDAAKIIQQNRTLLIAEFSKDNFKSLKGKVFHWDCKKENKPNHINLKDFIQEIITKGEYPKNRKEKYDHLLKYLYKTQDFEGAEISIKARRDFYGRLYFDSFDELKFFLREMERKEIIKYFEEREKAQFTFYGLEYIDTLQKADVLNIQTSSKAEYDIALSFAGEDRVYVEKVAQKLIELGVKVFYDDYEKIQLWGKDLYQHLNDIYKNKCQYCIVFVSESYAKKLWTKHELQSAQTRAFKENKEYILPVRFDSTELPGLNETIGYIDCSKVKPEEIAMLAAEKIKL